MRSAFYYEDSLGLLRTVGAELVPFSPLSDSALPAGLDGLYLGGGYPELYAAQLSENRSMCSSVRAALEAGLPCIAECGGFMYLTEAIGEHPMVGFLPGRCFDAGKLARFGYVTLTAERDNLLCRAGGSIPAHEFHHWDAEQTGDTFTAAKPLRPQLAVRLRHGHPLRGLSAFPFLRESILCRPLSGRVPKGETPCWNRSDRWTLSAAASRSSPSCWGDRKLDPENELVIKRAIHTTADFDYADNLVFSDHAVTKGIEALRAGCDIVTDTQMAKAGINKTILASLGGEVHCFMSDPDVAAEAKARRHPRHRLDGAGRTAPQALHLCHRQRADGPCLARGPDGSGQAAPGAHHRCAGRLRQRH